MGLLPAWGELSMLRSLMISCGLTSAEARYGIGDVAMQLLPVHGVRLAETSSVGKDKWGTTSSFSTSCEILTTASLV